MENEVDTKTKIEMLENQVDYYKGVAQGRKEHIERMQIRETFLERRISILEGNPPSGIQSYGPDIDADAEFIFEKEKAK